MRVELSCKICGRGYSSMVGREEVFQYSAQYPLFRYSIPMLPEAAQFGGTPACQWFSGLELFLPRIRRAELGGGPLAGCGKMPCSCPSGSSRHEYKLLNAPLKNCATQ